jgi:hypothetical protein
VRKRARPITLAILPAPVQPLIPASGTAAPARGLIGASTTHNGPRLEPLQDLVFRRGLRDHSRRFIPPSTYCRSPGVFGLLSPSADSARQEER